MATCILTFPSRSLGQ